ncbi:hypothetical protein Cal6303_0407 [Calothrix sp. PCC 6303]|nr:hypothetical protein Cal6303_0407 [Calothrix sp. PCC 6303]
MILGILVHLCRGGCQKPQSAKLQMLTCADVKMRSNVDPQKIEQLMKALGREARGSGCIYFTGGASALLIGWRNSTVDIDIRLDPEPPGIFQAIAKLKQQLERVYK